MKTAIITGAGSGIGAATAYQLEKEGYQLLLVGRTESKLRATLNSLKEIHHSVLAVDITDQKALKEGYQKHLKGKDVHAIFANAGIGGENHYGSEDRWDTILNINLTGTYYSVQEALPYLKESTSVVKHVLMTSSCLARFGVPNYTAYCTSKAGLLGLAKSMSLELSSHQILVNALCPGWVETEMAQAGIQKLADHQGVDYQSAYQEQMGYVPLGRMSDPQEIANFVAFMFSDKQRSITGQGLDINNGSFMI
ncbi:MAG: SDR family oxidoreductase [Bacteroidota bacterium]